ncbi:MAG: two-component sensor histidine kinase [Deltaproteobacteria bacterium]|nr:two-component sensor histidine kinase [Deltaproteobacteria bacterium]
MADKQSRYYRLLTRNMVLIIASVSLTPLVLSGGLILNQFGQAYHQKVIDHIGELIQKHRLDIDSFLTDRLADIRVLARSYDPEQLADGNFLRQRLSLLREEYRGVYVDLGLIEIDGLQTAYAGPFNLLGADYSEAAWFQAAIESEHFISDVFTGLRGSPHFIVAVKKSCQGRSCILRATMDFEAFNALVESISLGRTGLAFILNRAGEFQTKPRFEVSPNRKVYLEALKGGLDAKRVTISEAANQAGRKSIYAVAPLKGGDWVLWYQQESADALSQLHHAEKTALILFLVGGLVIIVVAFLISRRMVGRIAKADRQKTIMNEQVLQAGRLASVGELAAGIAHEINNPVAIMVEEAGWIEDLLEEEDLNSGQNREEFQRAVEQIQTQGERCKGITHKLLSFARKTDPDIHQVNLNDLVEDVTSFLAQKSRYANVKIEVNLFPELPSVAASPSELQQVVLTLVTNAVDAITSEGGTVSLPTRAAQGVSLTTRADQGKVVIEVADTGQGIPEVNLPRIFDPFFTTKPVGQGTGLGLSICYGIVDKLGGEISVRSEVGRGTVFTISLPASDNSESTHSPPESGSAAFGSPPGDNII